MGGILAQQQSNTTTYLRAAVQVPSYTGFYKDMMFFTLRDPFIITAKYAFVCY